MDLVTLPPGILAMSWPVPLSHLACVSFSQTGLLVHSSRFLLVSSVTVCLRCDQHGGVDVSILLLFDWSHPSSALLEDRASPLASRLGTLWLVAITLRGSTALGSPGSLLPPSGLRGHRPGPLPRCAATAQRPGGSLLQTIVRRPTQAREGTGPPSHLPALRPRLRGDEASIWPTARTCGTPYQRRAGDSGSLECALPSQSFCVHTARDLDSVACPLHAVLGALSAHVAGDRRPRSPRGSSASQTGILSPWNAAAVP